MEAALDFCPYEIDEKRSGEFKKIDMDNLAYELVFHEGYNIGMLQTILPGCGFIRSGTDERREKYNDTSICHMLWEALEIEGKSGIERLKALVDAQNAEVLRTQASMKQYDTGNADQKQDDDLDRIWQKKLLKYELREADQVYIVRYDDQSGERTSIIMEAIPCCPSCHQRFPVGWMCAEDFCGISLLARSGGGKTTFLVSMMTEDWRCLNYLGSDWAVSPAHDVVDGRDGQYCKMKKAAEQLNDEGICPDHTAVGHLIPPVFLNVSYKKHKMIVGLYDNSGEVLKVMDPAGEKISMLLNMYAHIYMIEPEQMSLRLPEKDVGQKSFGCRVLSLKEQGALQREHDGEEVSGHDLLEKTTASRGFKKKRGDPMNMYQKMKKVYQDCGLLDRLKKQHLACTVIKCDLLEGLDEIEEFSAQSWLLFERQEGSALFNDEQRFARERLIRDFFSRFVFRNPAQEESLRGDFGGSVSWHCISALGCDTEEVEDGNGNDRMFQLLGEYDPIRVAEPLVACMEKRVGENRW